MRKTEEKWIVTFPTTAAALAMERAAREVGAPGRLIPTPVAITASCGLAWMVQPEKRQEIQELLSKKHLQYSGLRAVAF